VLFLVYIAHLYKCLYFLRVVYLVFLMCYEMIEGAFVWFTDHENCHTQYRTSATWIIYSPTIQLVVLGGAYLGSTTNNVTEYSAMIELLRDAILNGIVY